MVGDDTEVRGTEQGSWLQCKEMGRVKKRVSKGRMDQDERHAGNKQGQSVWKLERMD